MTCPPLHPADKALQNSCPTVMVPRFGELEPLTENGHRFLSASDGLWVEIRRPWLHLMWPVAQQNGYPMPYGTLSKKIELAFGTINKDLVDQFIKEAKEAVPHEMGAWLVWDDLEKKLIYRRLEMTEAGPARLRVNLPKLDDHESLAVDLHSHSLLPAFFSLVDDQDDLMAVKIAGVYGQLDRSSPSFKFRLCIGGKFVEINHYSEAPDAF